jgi:hypothetical protein
MDRDLEQWLTAANEQYRAEEIPFRARPFRAMSDYTREHQCTLEMGSPTAKDIFRWFEEHSAPGSHAMGAMFTGSFYYDAFFWPLHIPIVYGEAPINAFNCLETMPLALKDRIAASREDLWRLALYWADCVDYAYGFDDMSKEGKLSARALEFAVSGSHELMGSIAQVVSPRPNTKAILGFRMATEIFLKAILVQESGATEAALKRFGHKIGDLATECQRLTGNSSYVEIARSAAVFPDVAERYEGSEWPLAQVWQSALIAQAAASCMARRYSDRDLRSQVIQSAGERENGRR